MKIRKLQLKNIGVFDDETIEFQSCPSKDKAEIHILTGQNGSGKSTILMALASIFNKKISELYAKRFRSEGSKNEYVVTLDDGLLYDFSRTKIINKGKNGVTTILEVTTPFSNSVQRNKHLEKYIEIASSQEKHVFSQAQTFDSFDFAVFAYSGYRFVESKKVELLKKIRRKSSS